MFDNHTNQSLEFYVTLIAVEKSPLVAASSQMSYEWRPFLL